MNLDFLRKIDLSAILDYFSNIDWNGSLIRLILLIVIVLLLSFLINFFFQNTIFGKSYRIFVAPGVIVHEMSHALLCLMTGAKITKMSLFDKNGGSVEHHPSKLPFIGSILISLAPFVFGSVIIYFLAELLGFKQINFFQIDYSFSGIISFFKNVISQFHLSDIRSIIIAYLIISVAVTMTPSSQDLKNIVYSVLVLVIILILAIYCFHLNLLGIFVPIGAFYLLSMVIFVLILSLFLSIILYILSKVFK